MSEIKPIQTRYKGYNFRSRLEARWAIFFDALGIEWEYEPEGYDLGELGWYLPDFRILSPYGNFQIYEIKPKGDKYTEEIKKIKLLETLLNKAIITIDDDGGTIINHGLSSCELLEGDPYSILVESRNHELKMCPRCGLIQMSPGYGSDEDNYGCTVCDGETECGGGNPYYESKIFRTCFYTPHKGFIMVDCPSDVKKIHRKLLVAATAARSARFEHGECGAT